MQTEPQRWRIFPSLPLSLSHSILKHQLQQSIQFFKSNLIFQKNNSVSEKFGVTTIELDWEIFFPLLLSAVKFSVKCHFELSISSELIEEAEAKFFFWTFCCLSRLEKQMCFWNYLFCCFKQRLHNSCRNWFQQKKALF